MGRTNIDIDDELVTEAMRRYGLKTRCSRSTPWSTSALRPPPPVPAEEWPSGPVDRRLPDRGGGRAHRVRPSTGLTGGVAEHQRPREAPPGG